MLRSNQLFNSVFSFTAGITLGVLAANYFSVADNAGNQLTAATNPPQIETAVMADKVNQMLTVADSVQPKRADGMSVSVKDRVDEMTPGMDISLVDTADINRQETTTTEASPEELASQPVVERVVRLGDQETRELENKLRQDSASAALVTPQDNAGLLGHEML